MLISVILNKSLVKLKIIDSSVRQLGESKKVEASAYKGKISSFFSMKKNKNT